MADTNYCRKSSFTDTDWEKIYEVAFRPDQRTPLSQLHDGLKSGHLLLHRSSAHEGLLCFSVTNILPTVALLAYLATDPTKRSSGIGSKHIKALIAEVRADHPNLLGMFAEIESTRQKGISEEERKHRKRRLAFYHRLGFKRYAASYTIPSYDPGIADEEGDLIWLDFHTGQLTCDAVAAIIKEIYVKAYMLHETDNRVISVPVISGDVAACDVHDDTVTATADAANPKITAETNETASSSKNDSVATDAHAPAPATKSDVTDSAAAHTAASPATPVDTAATKPARANVVAPSAASSSAPSTKTEDIKS